MQKSERDVKKYIIGIDEAGRGPLAGPVTVGIVMVEKSNAQSILKPLLKLGLNDSKQMKEGKREEIFGLVKDLEAGEAGSKILHTTYSISPKMIDKNGMTKCVQTAINCGLKKLVKNPDECDVRLDGLLKAPSEFKHQKTIIKGDTKEPTIMLASVMAKVTRDRYMCKQSRKFPQYGFEKHKGYGTLMHREAIRRYKPTSIHRMSYLAKII